MELPLVKLKIRMLGFWGSRLMPLTPVPAGKAGAN
jgi:hypothetical protein